VKLVLLEDHMDEKQQRILSILINAKALCVPQTQSGPNGPGRQFVGPLRIVDTEALQTNVKVRTGLVKLSAHLIARTPPAVDAVSSSSDPFGSEWFADMVAYEMGKPLLRPREIGHILTIQGSVPFGGKVWLVDADPDAGSHLMNAVEMIFSSQGSGCEISGILAIFERNGQTRSAIAKRFPEAAYIALVDLQACLQALANGEMSGLLSPAIARRALYQLNPSSGTTMRPPPGSSVP